MAVPVAARVPTGSGRRVADGRADTRCTPGVCNPQVSELDIVDDREAAEPRPQQG
jgi:hypothetical protein